MSQGEQQPQSQNAPPIGRREGLVEGAKQLAGLVHYTWRRLVADRCLSIAGSLSYTTLLSIVPLAAVGLAAFSAFPVFEGVQETLQKFIFQNFVPAASEAVRQQFTRFVANTGQLTAIGIVVLMITALMLLSTIEDTFNVIWRQTQSRAFGLRFLTYWAILTLSPLLLGASLAVSSYIFTVTEVLQLEILKGPAGFFLRLLPFILSVVAFALLYIVMPNRRVGWRDALAGAITAALLFQALKLLFLLYVTNFPSFETIYGAVSAVPLFLVWMYLTWCAVLVGAELAAAIPEWRQRSQRARRVALDPTGTLTLAVGLLAVAHSGQARGEAYEDEELAAQTDTDLDRAAALIDRLVAARYFARSKDEKLLVARDLRQATLYELMADLGLVVAPASGAAPTEAEKSVSGRLAALIARGDDFLRDAMGVELQELIEGAAERPKRKRPS